MTLGGLVADGAVLLRFVLGGLLTREVVVLVVGADTTGPPRENWCATNAAIPPMSTSMPMMKNTPTIQNTRLLDFGVAPE